jgi:hypothetical protein
VGALTVAVHQHYQRAFILILHDQGLDHGVLIHLEEAGELAGAAPSSYS